MKGTGLAISTAFLLSARLAAGEAIRWVPIGPTLAPQGSLRLLDVGPASAPGLVFVATPGGVQKTENGGGSWTAVEISPGESAVSLAIDPVASNIVYASTQAPLPVYPFTGGLYKSIDRGKTWTRITTMPSATIYDVRVIAVPAPRVFAATHQGIYCSPDGGTSWVLVGSARKPVQRLAFSPHRPLRAYAFGDETVFRSDNAGDAWEVATSGFTIYAGSVAIDSTDPSVVLVSGHILGPTTIPTTLCRRTRDAGATWSAFDAAGSTPNTSLFLSDGTLLVGTFGLDGTVPGPVLRSRDRGLTWESVSDGFDDAVAVALAASGSVLVGASVERVFLSSGLSCTASGSTLCLAGGRFAVSVSWTASNIGQTGQGQSMPLTSDSGAFWFFQPSNIELVIKVLDGRAVNGHFWVFYGALSNVGYTINVTDTETGAQKTYTNPEGTLASHADTEAF